METQGDLLLKMSGSIDTWEEKLQDPTATPIFLPFEFLKAITCDFSVERELGRGGYGVVYKGVLLSGQIIAVKKLFDLHRLEDEIFQKEVRSLMGIKHKNVVRFVGYCAKSSWEAIDLRGSGNYIFAETRERLLCFEHICNKSLDKYISDESSGLEWNTRYEIVRGICAGLHYLHEKCHIVHLDLKPENILMDATMVPKIADFGLSRIFGDKQSRIITVNRPGTHGYMAPEYILQGVVSIKADIYSLGVIIIEMLTGSRNYPLSAFPDLQHFSRDNSSQSTSAPFQCFKEKILETWRTRLPKSREDRMLEQVRVCIELGIQCVEPNPGNRPATKYMIDRLDEVSIIDVSIKTSVSRISAVVQAGEASDAPQEGDKRSEMSPRREEAYDGHHAELTDTYENMGPEKTKSEATNSLTSVKHKNIARFLGYCADIQWKVIREGDKIIAIMKRERLLCFEYLRNGNLQMHLTDGSGGFDWHTCYQTIKGICQGLDYLHKNCISHMDLKPENVLFDEKMVPKILEYGFSRVFSEEIGRTILKDIDGALAYMTTPEYLAGGEITLKSDIYCLGVIIMQIVTGQNNENYSNIASMIFTSKATLQPSGEELQASPVPNAPMVLQPTGVRIVLKVPMNYSNSKSLILRAMSKVKGIQSLTFDSSESTLTVVGNVDVVVVVTALRKMKYLAQIIMVDATEKVDIPVHDQEPDSRTRSLWNLISRGKQKFLQK
ncbi:hypothetical protein VPH35_113226 [Triticum aestivum]